MDFVKLAEAKKLHSELETKLRDIYVDFSNYGPAISVCLTKQMDEAKELLDKLNRLECGYNNIEVED